MKTILTNRGDKILVDNEDYEVLKKHKYYLDTSGYARRNNFKSSGPKNSHIYLHREVIKCPDGLCVDHINRNKLDNRKCNLRIVTYLQNNLNKEKPKNSTSKYIGVHKLRSGVFVGQIQFKGKKYYKRFKTEIEAAIFYNEKAKEFFGDFARTNSVVKL